MLTSYEGHINELYRTLMINGAIEKRDDTSHAIFKLHFKHDIQVDVTLYNTLIMINCPFSSYFMCRKYYNLAECIA